MNVTLEKINKEMIPMDVKKDFCRTKYTHTYTYTSPCVCNIINDFLYIYSKYLPLAHISIKMQENY